MVTSGVSRVIVVVLDGLRPDAIDAFGLCNIARLRDAGAYSLSAQTVAPSVTACAMASLISGAAPRRHGLTSDRFRLPAPRGEIHPVPRVLAAHGLPSSAHLAEIPLMFRPIARRLARIAGMGDCQFRGRDAHGILAAARTHIARQRDGFMLFHWPDADRAGHAHGWMSAPFARAAKRMDDAFGELVRVVGLERNRGTVLIALADHGGGGANPLDHNSEHPTDRTIPIMLAGNAVVPGPISGPVSLLDVPATALWALGVPRPATYVGRPLIHAFAAARAAA